MRASSANQISIVSRSSAFLRARSRPRLAHGDAVGPIVCGSPWLATLNHAGDGLPLSVVELGRLSCRLAIQETVRTAGVEAQHPVPDDLKSDTADLGRLGARCPIVDSREC